MVMTTPSADEWRLNALFRFGSTRPVHNPSRNAATAEFKPGDTTMNRKLSTTLAAALIAVTLSPALTGAAEAGSRGSISISVSPTNHDEERLMRAGLGIYSLVQGARSASHIRQNGTGNSAGLAQNGWNNGAVIHQRGRGHEGTIQQNGNHNRYGLFQFGRNTAGHVVQNGNGGTGATFQFGW
jgi:hypothetical protein